MTELLRPFQALQSALRPDDRIVISGASGWIGRSLIQELYLADPSIVSHRLLALGANSREISIFEGPNVFINETNLNLVREWQPTIAIHLAYLTADRLPDMNSRNYKEKNKEISQFGSDMQSISSLRAFMFASSGAALQVGSPSSLGSHPYSAQKSLDEATYTSSPLAQETPTLVPRLWSVTGPHCTRPQAFAFSDMILQCLDTGVIRVHAPEAVFRRYVDAGEFLSTCVAQNLHGVSGIIDSAGHLIEIRQLAEEIVKVLGGRVESTPVNESLEPNAYYTNSELMNDVALQLGTGFSGLHEQISQTARGLIQFIK